ncbi:hypothetical protein GNE10_23890 [Nostoc sp. 2RC]|nr:hypothetical protein [Nostoc sp. 2RC]
MIVSISCRGMTKGDRIDLGGTGDRLCHAFILKYNFILVNYSCQNLY